MISACSSSVVQRESATWGNQAAAMTCKPQAVSAKDWHDMSVVLVKKLGVEVTEGTPWGHPNKKKTPILTTNKFLPWSIMNDFLPLRKRGKCERVVHFQVDAAVVPTPTHSFLCLLFPVYLVVCFTKLWWCEIICMFLHLISDILKQSTCLFSWNKVFVWNTYDFTKKTCASL